jgi:hypothetical protein
VVGLEVRRETGKE